jgi:hypothetical protein
MWLNPVSEEIASLMTELEIHSCNIPFCSKNEHDTKFAKLAEGTDLKNSLAIEFLFDCLLSPTGIATPAALEAAKQKPLLDLALQSHQERTEKERQLQLAEGRRLAQERWERASAQINSRKTPATSSTQRSKKHQVKCKACGHPLDPDFESRGYHFNKDCEKQMPNEKG